MPYAPLGPCRVPGCPNRSNCAVHRQSAPAGDRPSAAAQGYGAKWRKLRTAYLRQHPYCEWPGCEARATDVDHIIPKAQGGADEWENLQGLCRSHHSRKTAMSDGGFGRARRETKA